MAHELAEGTIRDDGNSASFDPRSWARQPKQSGSLAAEAGDPAPDQASFDPSTWGKSPRPPNHPAPEERPEAAPATRKLIAAGAAALLILAGSVSAYLARPSAPEQTARPIVIAEQTKGDVERPPPPPPEAGQSRRIVTVAGPEELPQAIRDLGIDPSESAAIARQVLGYVGNSPGELRLTADLARSAEGQLSIAWLEVGRIDGAGVRLIANGNGFDAQTLAPKLTTRTIAVRGEMATTFYNSAVDAGVDDSLISDFAAAFSYDVDFQFELHPGDIFEGTFEQDYNPWGQPVGAPRLLFVSLRLDNKSLRFYRFKAGGQYGWFDANGRSNRRSLMRTPVDGARVASGFGMRFHPIKHFMRLHGGTDFAAPDGTPVYASGNGKVFVAGCCHGDAGTMIAIQHDTGWVTHYFHLSRIMPGIAPGARVTQGERIGDVGHTGGATGPHLHYEVVINGTKVDPLKVDTGQGITLTGAQMTAFRQQRDRVDSARASDL